MTDLPRNVIDGMDYRTRQQNFQQELSEVLQKTGRLPLSEYDKIIKKLVKKWKV